MSQRGAISLPVVIAVVLGLGFGASAYLNYAQFQRSQQDAKLLNGEITDLRYQVQQDKLASGASPSPSPSDSPSPSPSATPTPTPAPAVAGASTSAPSATLVKACNLHASASTKSTVVVSYTSIKVPTAVTLVGGQTPNWQNLSLNGKTGYVQSSCLQY